MRKCQLIFLKRAIEISSRAVIGWTIFAVASYAAASYAGENTDRTYNAPWTSVDVTSLEESIAAADAKELNRLEVIIARVIQTDPGNVSANYLMSALLLKMFSFDPASYTLLRQSTELASQTYDLDPTSDLGVSALGNILEISGDSARGISLLEEASRSGIRFTWRSNLVKAKLLSTAGHDVNSDEILNLLRAVLNDPRASIKLVSPILADVLISKDKNLTLAEKITELQTWKELCPSVEMSLELGIAFALDKQYSKAYQEYDSILKVSPRNTEALTSQGIIAAGNHDLKNAINKFTEAIASSSDAALISTAKIHLALALIEQNSNPNAAKLASIEAIQSSQERDSALVAILTAYRQANPKIMPISLLLDLQDAVPGIALGHAILAEMLGEGLHRYDEATISFTNAISLDPGHSEYYNGRGLASMGLLDVESALEDFETAADVDPQDASARYNTACAQARLGHRDDALESLRQSFELDIRLQELAKTDEDLVSLRSEARFEALVNSDLKPVAPPFIVGH
jgi:tetratricopeptide (TPR) repeat protein